MNCTNCSKTTSQDSNFCEHCGHKIEKSERANNELTDKVIEHLEFLGYEIEEVTHKNNADKFIAYHVDKSNLVMDITTEYGIMVRSYYIIDKNKAKDRTSEMHSAINQLNLEGIICSFCYDISGCNLVCSSWFPAIYSKKEFSTFLNLYETDIKSRMSSSAMDSFI